MDNKQDYVYHTSQKSYLDKLCDNFWNNTALFINDKYSWITPNMVTLSGVIPVLILSLLFFSGFIGSIVYFLMMPACIFYLNMDAIDGKLARLSGRSSPFGQLLDHGCDTIACGFITMMLTCAYCHDNIYELSYFTKVIIFATTFITNFLMLCANLKEFYTGIMVVSMGNISTTEIMYCISFLFGSIYIFSVNILLLTIFHVCIVLSLLATIWFILNTLKHPTNAVKAGTQENVVPLEIDDVIYYFFVSCIIFLSCIVTNFSLMNTAFSVVILSSVITDVIYANGLKFSSINYHKNTLILTGFRLFMITISDSIYTYLVFSLVPIIDAGLSLLYKKNVIKNSLVKY